MRAALVVLFLGLPVLLGCGGEAGDAESAADETASTPSAAESQKIEPCQLLTDEQVATVVSQAQSMTISAGGSLLADVDDYQCTWANPDTHTLVVIVHVAANDSSWAGLRPNPDQFSGARVVTVGDGGWLESIGDDLHVTATKGQSLIILQLDVPDAGAKSEALIELARAVAGKVR